MGHINHPVYALDQLTGYRMIAITFALAPGIEGYNCINFQCTEQENQTRSDFLNSYGIHAMVTVTEHENLFESQRFTGSLEASIIIYYGIT